MVKETGQVEDGGMGEGEGVGPRSATPGAAWSGIARPVAGPTKARNFKAGGAFLNRVQRTLTRFSAAPARGP